MPETDDMQLLKQYAAHGSQDAFAALVQRNINLVYSVAIRHVRDAEQAQDITQAVFIILAQKADRLRKETILSGWLYQTTRYASATFLRSERRRQERDQEAFMQAQLQNQSADSAWEGLAPVLDDAMARLGQTDRNAIVLRFFNDNSVQEVAQALNLSEPAAKKRVARALEKLRRFFVKRGVALSAVTLSSTLAAHSVQAAPSGLAASVSGIAVAKGSAAGLSTLALTKGTLKFMAWTKIKTAAWLSAGVLLATGTATTALKLSSTTPASAMTQDVEGAWETSSAVAGPNLRLVLNVIRRIDDYHATVDLPDLGVKVAPVDKFTYHHPKIHIEQKAMGFTCDATLSADGQQMSGVAHWNNQSSNFTLKRSDTPSNTPDLLTESDYSRRAGSYVQGYWKGALESGGAAYPVILKLAEPSTGVFRAEWSSPERGVKDLPASAVSYQNPNLKLDFAGIGASYEGVVDRYKNQITGTWNVRGQTFPITLSLADPKDDQADEAKNNYNFTRPGELQGHWHCMLDRNKRRVRMALDIANRPDGSYRAAIASGDFGTFYDTTRAVSLSATAVRIEWKGIGSSFIGELKGEKLSGTLYLGRSVSPVVFERSKPISK